jgi:hypothetical protein
VCGLGLARGLMAGLDAPEAARDARRTP